MTTLRFDFLSNPITFSNPICIIQTDQLNEVQAKLHQVEKWVERGYYAAGFVSYEAAPAFQPYYLTPAQGELPLLWFAICTAPQKATTVPWQLTPKSVDMAWQMPISEQRFTTIIDKIKAHIMAGDSYQTNYTLRLTGQLSTAPEVLYHALLHAQQAAYAAYLEFDHFTILCASPELFFHRQGDHIITKPMKGTAPRGKYEAEDQYYLTMLNSEKNRAENVMIVDLLRNDLSQIAQTGSVKVDKLFTAEPYPTLWQLTSTISADLAPTMTISDIFRALFPCGSITGAPKASTMKIISQLEQQARGIYCGSIGYITPMKEAIFNIAIRTVVINTETQQAEYGVGSGITWDSTARDEYQEILQKTKVLRPLSWPSELLESLLLEQGHYYLLNAHLARLSRSASYFNFTCPIETIREQLLQLANTLHNPAIPCYKVRLILTKLGDITLTTEAISPQESPIIARLASSPISSDNPLIYHKTTSRAHLPTPNPHEECLLYNQHGEFTEFVNGNVVFLIDGDYVTPALSCGLLAGTMREHLLAQGKIKEGIIKIEHLPHVEAIIFINSVRKWRNVNLYETI